MRRIVVAAVLVAGVAGAGCSESKDNKDPKPVNAKEDPRIKRSGEGGPGAGVDQGSK